VLTAIAIVAGGAGNLAWQRFRSVNLPDGFASSNRRIEATEIDVATKLPGRIIYELVDEGDLVTDGQVVAHIDVESRQAQFREDRVARGGLRAARPAGGVARQFPGETPGLTNART
jgi:HlyD family secretion protein